MFAQISTVAFLGIEARPIDVQVQIGAGLPSFSIVGLPDKAVAESRERVRAALCSIGLGLPAKRITVNLAPADLPKEGSHYDLPIAVGLMVASGAMPGDEIGDYVVIGELGLDGAVAAVTGTLPAAIGANSSRQGADLPLCLRQRGRLGLAGNGHPCAAASPFAGQSLQRHRRAAAPGSAA